MAVSLNNAPHILHQELALDTYLKTLLEELPVAVPSPPPEATPATPPRTLQPVTKPLVKNPVKQPQTLKAKAVRQEFPPCALPLAVMPEWAQHEFQAIFFKVGPLILATPLTELSRTLKFGRVITKIPKQPSWFMGLLEDQGKKIGILDTSQLILGKSKSLNRDLIEQPFKSMLVTQDGNWALACDEVLSIAKVTPEQVRWRTDRQSRPWLIGTVIEELTAVIDVSRLTPRRKGG
ncbi:MAG: chemotaxis protein CheW [Gammaproteobacteria bacterium HGW-Gammaproteobacteria-3]|nr:MAG: chemotaxis protein CheW [Gammaproteobacteria bacterium HGW-Gammaproteobacteria-3]